MSENEDRRIQAAAEELAILDLPDMHSLEDRALAREKWYRFKYHAERVLAAVDAAAPAEPDAREHLHAKCNCVPDLGPAHCHLCGDEQGSPVPWPECSAVRAAAPAEAEGWEWAISDQEYEFSPIRWLPLSGRSEATVRELAEAQGRQVARRRKAGPWSPVPGGEGENDDQA